MNQITEQENAFFQYYFDLIAEAAYENSKSKGFWEDKPNDGEKIALMHSELSEALEALRDENPFAASRKIPQFTQAEEEFADVVIRIGDYAGKNKLRIGAAIVAKMAYNASRPYKHGRRF